MTIEVRNLLLQPMLEMSSYGSTSAIRHLISGEYQGGRSLPRGHPHQHLPNCCCFWDWKHYSPVDAMEPFLSVGLLQSQQGLLLLLSGKHLWWLHPGRLHGFWAKMSGNSTHHVCHSIVLSFLVFQLEIEFH